MLRFSDDSSAINPLAVVVVGDSLATISLSMRNDTMVVTPLPYGTGPEKAVRSLLPGDGCTVAIPVRI
jgi:hypothetical protein